MMAIKAIEHDTDWYLIPNELYTEFYRLTEKFNSDDYPHRYDDEEEFNKKFDKFRINGDLNNIQLYIEKIN